MLFFKKKIKIIISDLHLGQGRFLPDGSKNPLEDFFYDEKFIELIEYYSLDKYHNYEVEIIFNGDFFNMIQVDIGEDIPDYITENYALQKTKNIIRGHKQIFIALNKFLQNPKHNLTFIIGNHDPGLFSEKVQNLLKEVLSDKIKFFPFSYTFDGFYIEHGHQHEPANRFDNFNYCLLSEKTNELIIDLPIGGYFVISFISKLKLKRPHIDKVVPFRAYLNWVLFNDTKFALQVFFGLIIFYLRNRFHRNPKRRAKFKLTLDRLKQIFFPPKFEKIASNILNEGNYHTVILGHTHEHTHKIFANGKEYFNCGTWVDTTNLDLANLGRNTKLTFVLIDYHFEKPLTFLKVWRGKYREEEVLS